MGSITVEALRELLNGKDGQTVWFGRSDGPIVAIASDMNIDLDPDGKPCIILFEVE